MSILLRVKVDGCQSLSEQAPVSIRRQRLRPVALVNLGQQSRSRLELPDRQPRAADRKRCAAVVDVRDRFVCSGSVPPVRCPEKLTLELPLKAARPELNVGFADSGVWVRDRAPSELRPDTDRGRHRLERAQTTGRGRSGRAAASSR